VIARDRVNGNCGKAFARKADNLETTKVRKQITRSPGHQITRFLRVLPFLAFFATLASAADKQEVTIPAGQYQLHGCFWTPDGPGPYPVMIFNHGSEKNPAPCGPPELADFYQKKGFVFFTFQRHGHGASAGDYIMDLQRQAYMAHALNRSAAQQEAVGLQELYNKDVEAAVAWLKEQKWADPSRIAMMGISFGGTQTILSAEKGMGVKAFLPYAPAAQSWNPALADRLKKAVRQARAPIFIIQAQNDYSVEPAKVLGSELEKKGPPNHAKIYPSFGSTTQDGHWGFGSRRDGIAIWSPDVDAFLEVTMPKAAVSN
jgi:carboxymethylenebutenolidase